MISKFLNRRPKVTAPANPSIPKGVVVWAVGDVHGRLDLLETLVEAIVADANLSNAERKVVIFLGDYVDRGPDSRGVLQYLSALPADGGIEWRFLAGNHERTMSEFLRDPTVGARWCEYGGGATLASYGLRKPDLAHRAETWKRLSADLDHKLTPKEREFLEGLELSITLGDYFFTHAGARPGVALEAQNADDLLWIRGSFLTSEVEFDKVIVHGHTPVADVHVDRRRLGLDTKAYASGVLTALRLEGCERHILQTLDGANDGPDDARPMTRNFRLGA